MLILKHFNKKLVALSKVLSFVLFLMLFPVYLLDVLRSYSNHKTKNTYVKKILLVDLHLIGDVVMLTPLLLEIKKIYTNASITLLCGDWAEQVLLNNPGLIDCYCIYNAPWVVKDRRKHGWYDLVKKILFLRKQGFDLAIDARGDFRNIAIMRFSCTERRAGFTFSGGGWLLSDKIDDSGYLDHIVSHHHKIALYLGSNISVTKFIPSLWLSSSEANYKSNHAGFIAVHLGASTPLRVLSLERATELIVYLLSITNKKLILCCSNEIKDLMDGIAIIPQVNDNVRVKMFKGDLREFMVEIASSSLYIGMDSSGAHIAAAFNVPSIVIFGPALPETCHPIGGDVHIVSLDKKLDCRPCNQKNCINDKYQECYNLLDFEKTLGGKVKLL